MLYPNPIIYIQCIEDINAYLKDDLLSCPNTMVPSSDTILKGISELATDNLEYSSSKNNTYSFNPATKLNDLMVKFLLETGQLKKNQAYDVDFDYQFIETQKYDAKRTYKHFKGYGPGVTTINGLTVHIENRDGNANVRFMQEETLKRMFANLENNGLKVRRFRADWQTVEINNETYQVRSFFFDSFEGVEHCRLVVQQQKRKSNEQLDLFDGEYTYRCIPTNDWNMEDEQVIRYYNERGASERVFDQMNNDFGWSSLPKSFMNENAEFLLITAMAHNFYHYLVSIPLMALFGIEPTSRIKRFIFKFISVPAKWIKTAKIHVLKFYTSRPYDKIELLWSDFLLFCGF